MIDVQMFWSLSAECVDFSSQVRSGAVLMESRHGEGHTDKQGLYHRKRSDRNPIVRLRCGVSAPSVTERLRSNIL